MSVVVQDGTYMILGDEAWLPGMYATRAVAKRAEAEFSATQLAEIAARVGGRLITAGDLDAAAGDAAPSP